MIDPRPSIVGARLAGVRTILAVASGKGGVGKSACATVGALALARRGLSVGLLDLDFQGSSCHLFLGCQPGLPEEDRGLVPLEPTAGLRFATIASFTGERPAAMRGRDLTGALRELLAVTRWGTLDVLIVDMPPGIYDTTLEWRLLVPRCRYLVVTTPSRVASAVSSRLLQFLQGAGASVAGIVENVATASSDQPTNAPAVLARGAGVPFLGRLPFDPGLEAAAGSPDRLLGTAFARALEPIIMAASG